MNARLNLLALTIPLLQTVAHADAAAAPAPAPAASAAPSPTAARDRFAGTYSFAGGEKQKAGQDAAIDKVVDGLFFAIRPIARSKLHDKTEIKTSIGFSFANGNVTSTSNGEVPATSRDDGTPAAFKAGGDNLKLSQKVNADGHLIQSFTSPEGQRVNDYVLAADGKTLNVFVTITSPKLPHPLRYVLTYRKG
jgi:hypothetical protein